MKKIKLKMLFLWIIFKKWYSIEIIWGFEIKWTDIYLENIIDQPKIYSNIKPNKIENGDPASFTYKAHH